MDWKTRFPVGLALLAALMLAGGVSAATSMRLASAHKKATVVIASHDKYQDPDESEPPDQPTPTEGGDRGVRGGSVERFHENCDLPAGASALEANWTHGEYVSAFAKAGDGEAHLAAAHSDCGKPTQSRKHAEKEKGKGSGKDSHSHGEHGHQGESKNHSS